MRRARARTYINKRRKRRRAIFLYLLIFEIGYNTGALSPALENIDDFINVFLTVKQYYAEEINTEAILCHRDKQIYIYIYIYFILISDFRLLDLLRSCCHLRTFIASVKSGVAIRTTR